MAERIGGVRLGIAALVGVLIGMAAMAVAPETEPSAAAPPEIVTSAWGHSGNVQWVEVRQADDAGKPAGPRSVMGQRLFSMDDYSCGVSGDQLRLRFDAPVAISGVDISVDIGGSLSLVEVMAAVNGEQGYGVERGSDPLAHTSWHEGGDRYIDKVTVLPAPVNLEAGDHVTIGAWLCSVGWSGMVSPEVIVHYQWR